MLYQIKKKLMHRELFWRYLFNMDPTFAFKKGSLEEEANRVISELRKNGVAFSSAEKLLPNLDLYNELVKQIEKLELENKDYIAQTRVKTDNPEESNEKSFMLFLLGEKPKFDPQSIYARFAEQAIFKAIADSYYRMKDTQLRYYNVWHTLPSKGEARTSQLWHRDREDLQILKVFVYLTDITEANGPFVYAPETHILGRFNNSEPGYHIESGVKRTQDEQMAKIVPAENWITGYAKKGDIVFADTHGYHKGGLARESDRLLYTFMYTSPACERFLFSKDK